MRRKEQLARTVFDVKNAQTNVAYLIEKLVIREPIRWVLEKVTRQPIVVGYVMILGKESAADLEHLVGSVRHPNHGAQATGRTYADSQMSGGFVHAPRTIVGPRRRVAQPVRLCSGTIEWFIVPAVVDENSVVGPADVGAFAFVGGLWGMA